jgi:serine/threonine protein kinase
LGKGRFGNVYRAQHNTTKFLTAVKQISLSKVSSKLIERLVYEIKIQSFLKHEHCLELYKYYKESANLYLVLELGESSLFDKLREKKFFSEVESVYYITQTIKALIYLHSHNIIHRDLKP